MVIVVGIALSVCLLGQFFIHLYHSLFSLLRSALSDWHVSLWSYLPYLMHCLLIYADVSYMYVVIIGSVLVLN